MTTEENKQVDKTLAVNEYEIPASEPTNQADDFIYEEEEKKQEENVVAENMGEDATLSDLEGSDKYFTKPNFFEVSEDNVVSVPPRVIPRLKEKELKGVDRDTAITAVTGTEKSVNAALERTDPAIFDNGGDATIDWFGTTRRSLETTTLADEQLVAATTRPNASWTNMLNYGTLEEPKYKGPAVDRKGFNPIDKNDTRSLAISRMTSIMGLGAPSFIPLYHTGIWIRLKTPTAAAFATLDELLVKERVEYGTLTRGVIFSNDSVVLRKHIANFILDHVIFSTAPNDDKDYLKSIIKITDLDEMMRGIMQTRYPDGYPYRQPCTADPNKCTHISEGIIDLREIQWTDTNALTAYQKTIMEYPLRRVTEEQLERYQEEFKLDGLSSIHITRDGTLVDLDTPMVNGVTLHIETPTLEQDEEYGIVWVQSMKRDMENTLKEKHDVKARQNFMAERVLVTYFKSYGQWVKSIDIVEAGQVIQHAVEREDIDDIFDFLSSDVRYVEVLQKSITNYINKTLVHVIGLKNYECPKCGQKHDTGEGNFHLILPLDMLSVFFILVRSSVIRSYSQSNT